MLFTPSGFCVDYTIKLNSRSTAIAMMPLRQSSHFPVCDSDGLSGHDLLDEFTFFVQDAAAAVIVQQDIPVLQGHEQRRMQGIAGIDPEC